MKFRFLAFLLISGLAWSNVRAQDPLNVVVTYSILGDIVQNVAGDTINLTVLVGADSDSHTYEPSPQDAITLSEADLIIENGLEFETWLDDLYASSQSIAPRIAVSEGIEPLEFGDEHAHEGEATPEATPEGEEHGEYDPHIWHSANNVIVMVETIRETLVTADSANEATYNANAEAYTAQLTELNDYIKEQVVTIPEDQRVIFTSHDTFGYFGRDYGFVVDSALVSFSTESADPSAADIAALITEIQDLGIKAIFAENVINPDLMQQIADNAGVILAPTLYTDALGAEGSAGATYLGMLRYNVDTIVSALTQ